MAQQIKLDKDKNFGEWLQAVLKEGEFVDLRYNVKGFVVHRPNAAICENVIFRYLEDELGKTGHKPAYFPAVIPEENFELEKKHVEKFEAEVFWITQGGSTPLEKRLALRPTSETAIYKMYSQWIRSWRDLPLKIYQRCQVWRYETKATYSIFRNREFYWIEAHDAFATKDEADKQVLEDMQTTEKVLHEKMGVPFFFFKRPQWDKFGGAVSTFAADALMPDGAVLQLPSTHLLGQNFAKVFDVQFLDREENQQYAWQTCYGPAVPRLFGAMLAIHGDNRGAIFPFDLAPTQIVIVPIYAKANKEKIDKKCKELFDKFSKTYRVAFDDSDKQPGEKYFIWEMRGAAVRIEIGGKEVEENSATVVRRDMGKREKISAAQLADYLEKAETEILKNLRERADKSFKDKISSANSWEELKTNLAKGGFVKVNLCTTEKEGESCAGLITAETKGGEVRGTLHGRDEKPDGSCIACGRKANAVVYVAKSY